MIHLGKFISHYTYEIQDDMRILRVPCKNVLIVRKFYIDEFNTKKVIRQKFTDNGKKKIYSNKIIYFYTNLKNVMLDVDIDKLFPYRMRISNAADIIHSVAYYKRFHW